MDNPWLHETCVKRQLHAMSRPDAAGMELSQYVKTVYGMQKTEGGIRMKNCLLMAIFSHHFVKLILVAIKMHLIHGVLEGKLPIFFNQICFITMRVVSANNQW